MKQAADFRPRCQMIGKVLVLGDYAADIDDADQARLRGGVSDGQGAPRVDVGTEQALRKAVLDASAIGHSTGPSGTAVLALLQRWGVLEAVRERLVQAPAGVPVGRLLAEGKASLGFQQTSELVGLAGVSVLGELPAGCEIVTRFTAAVCAASARRDEARALIAYIASPETAAAKRAHGLEPA